MRENAFHHLAILSATQTSSTLMEGEGLLTSIIKFNFEFSKPSIEKGRYRDGLKFGSTISARFLTCTLQCPPKYVETVKPDLWDALLIWTVCFVPGERKPLQFL